MLNICTVGQYWKEKFGEKVYRVGIDGGFTCPTRDGTKGIGGCYFCDEEGSRESYIKSSDEIAIIKPNNPTRIVISLLKNKSLFSVTFLPNVL